MNLRHHHISFPSIYVLLTLLVSAIGIIAWQLNCPQASDDYVYRCAVADTTHYDDDTFWMATGPEYSTWQQVWTGAKGHFLESNTRLTNPLYMAAQLCPLWAIKLMCGLFTTLMLFGILWLALGRNLLRRPWIAAAGVFLFWTSFTWSNNMQSGDYHFNYTLTSALWCAYLAAYLRLIDSPSRWKRVCLVLCMIPVCMFHEGFNVPALGFFFFDILFGSRGKRLAPRIAIFAICLCGILFMVSSGSGNRLESLLKDYPTLVKSAKYHIVAYTTVLLPIVVSLALAAIAWFRSKRRGDSAEARIRLLPWVGAVLAGTAFCVALIQISRALWGTVLFATVLSLLSLTLIFPLRPSRRPLLGRICLTAMLCLYCGWLWELVAWQKVASRIHDEIEAGLSPRGSASSNITFADISLMDNMPEYLMSIPFLTVNDDTFNSFTFAHYWLGPKHQVLAIADPALKDVPPEEWPRYPGNAGARGTLPTLILDTNFLGMIIVTVGPLPEETPWYARLLLGARDKVLPEQEAAYMWVWTQDPAFGICEGSYVDYVGYLPRSLRRRPILRVDTVPGTNSESHL